MINAGVDPNDIGMVIHTHLHWDHGHGTHLFNNAKVVVQESEISYVLNHLHCDQELYEHNSEERPPLIKFKDRIVTVSGDEEIFSGIRLLLVPGYSSGTQGVLVST